MSFLNPKLSNNQVPQTPENNSPSTIPLTNEQVWVEKQQAKNKPIETSKVTIGTLLQWANSANAAFVVGDKGNEVPLSHSQETRFQNVKYKIYTLIAVSIFIILYGPLTNAFQTTWNKWQEVRTLSQTINERIDDQHDYQVTTDYIKKIEENKADLINCINNEIACEDIPEEIKVNMDIVKWYIQIGSLQKAKMAINEAKILKSINEFITKNSDSLLEERKYNGIVTDINIGDNTVLENNIVQVPINLTITFNGQDNLIDFLTNLEHRVFYDQVDGLNNSILYKIQEIKYDIVNYKDSQDVEVLLYAYAYNK